MEKIFLQPTAKELTFNPKGSEYLCDSFAFEPIDDKTHHLGHLFLTGQVKNGAEDNAYLLNLLVSLAKREYYHEAATAETDPKQAFDATLKKLNDVLEDFFQKDDVKIDLGLVAIAGDQIHLSKLGKFKVLLARNGELIDILNNVQLFDKDREGTEKFSNIISGKIHDGDKIFAYCPNRQLTAREKSLKAQLNSSDQTQFETVLTGLSETAKNFQCSGLHIDIKKMKEARPVIRSIYEPAQAILAAHSPHSINSGQAESPKAKVKATKAKREESPVEITPVAAPVEAVEEPAKAAVVSTNEPAAPAVEEELAPPTESPDSLPNRAVSAEISLTRRPSLLAKLTNLKLPHFRLTRGWESSSLPRAGALRGWQKHWPSLLLSVLVVGGLAYGSVSLLNDDPNAPIIKSAQADLEQAESYLNSNDQARARALLSASLSSFLNVREADDKVTAMKGQLTELLDKVDLVSSQAPVLVRSLDREVVKLASSNIALGADSKVLKLDSELKELGTLPALTLESIQNIFINGQRLAAFNGSDQVAVVNIENGKSLLNQLKEGAPFKSAYLYQENLYVLSDNAIYKYASVTTGGDVKQTWFAGLASESPVALAIDGNIYVLTSNGTLITYFKGKESSRGTSGLTVGERTKLLTDTDNKNVYLVEFDKLRVRAISKTDGSLQATYKADNVANLRDAAISGNTLYLLGGDNKLWTLTVE